MPADVEQGSVGEGLMDDYTDRPRYQRNDYLGWIGCAKQPATRQKRMQQMLDELRVGGVHMSIEHPLPRRSERRTSSGCTQRSPDQFSI